MNLRGDYKTKILFYIQEKYPEFIDTYNDIYIKGNKQYWYDLSKEIQRYCESNNVKYINYFYHEEILIKRSCNDFLFQFLIKLMKKFNTLYFFDKKCYNQGET